MIQAVPVWLTAPGQLFSIKLHPATISYALV